MNKTKIEWVRNPDGSQGYSSNPFTGCLHGCSYCYARQESYGRCKQSDLSGYPIEQDHENEPFYPRYHPTRLLDIINHKKPAGIFLNDRSDSFASYWPQKWQDSIWEMILRCPQHRFYLLTKQPSNLSSFSPFPTNCWIGVTATDALMAYRAENSLARIVAEIKYISFEPLLGQIESLSGLLACLTRHIDWLIIGSQTKPLKPPRLEWVEEIVNAADKAGIPVFLKNNLIPILPVRKPFIHQDETGKSFPRQEMPK